MKIKKFLENGIDDWDDFKYQPVGERYEEEEEDDDSGPIDGRNITEEDMEGKKSEEDNPLDELCYYVRKFFKVNDIDDVIVEHEDADIKVYVFLERRENMYSLLHPFDVVEKIQKDILPQYDVEVELYSNKKGNPILLYSFIWPHLSDEEDVQGVEEDPVFDNDDKIPL